jgi:glycosyltransferase involved in cell wall biosynthesis
MPQVSVLMTVYNGVPYLAEAVESIQRQTLSDWQLIVVDDGSTDEGPAWLDQIKDPRIRVIHQPNAGAPAAANRGLKECDSEFVARLDADDVANPRRLQLQRDFLAARPQVGLAGTQVAPLGSRRVGRGLSLPRDHAAIVNALMLGRHGICHSSIMVRTQLLKDAGGYWARGVAEDHDMFLRVAERAELANLPELLLHYRILPGSLQARSAAVTRARIDFTAELARRRQARLPLISFEEFWEQRQCGPWWKRWNEALEAHAMAHYRRAQAEILGARPAIGYARLAWAAACSPQRTCQRIGRLVRHRRLSQPVGRTIDSV